LSGTSQRIHRLNQCRKSSGQPPPSTVDALPLPLCVRDWATYGVTSGLQSGPSRAVHLSRHKWPIFCVGPKPRVREPVQQRADGPAAFCIDSERGGRARIALLVQVRARPPRGTSAPSSFNTRCLVQSVHCIVMRAHTLPSIEALHCSMHTLYRPTHTSQHFASLISRLENHCKERRWSRVQG